MKPQTADDRSQMAGASGKYPGTVWIMWACGNDQSAGNFHHSSSCVWCVLEPLHMPYGRTRLPLIVHGRNELFSAMARNSHLCNGRRSKKNNNQRNKINNNHDRIWLEHADLKEIEYAATNRNENIIKKNICERKQFHYLPYRTVVCVHASAAYLFGWSTQYQKTHTQTYMNTLV